MDYFSQIDLDNCKRVDVAGVVGEGLRQQGRSAAAVDGREREREISVT